MTHIRSEQILPDTLETERLHLRPLKSSDAARIVQLANDPNIAYLLGSMPHPYTLDHANSFLARVAKKQTHVFGICLKSDKNQLIGTVGVGPRWSPEEPEIGFWIGVDYWENQYSSEAIQAILTYAFEFLNYEKIYCSCRIENAKPRNIIHSCGLVYIGRTERYFESPDQTYAMDKYFLTRKMWQESQAQPLKAAQ
ncbi:MAG: GNAT family N-acetyltransferase [Rhizobiales bacterium]|nr:GNAT family N-acetyltransferase [Hyphomicrobiales bacterium]NRB14683.1 GNAT family N-acetyltransferase [Hyphomicrobiales bacterium]